jgi:hypothetical protein
MSDTTPLNYGDNSGVTNSPTANTQDGGQAIAQAAAMNGSNSTQTAPAAQTQNYMGSMSHDQIQALKTQAAQPKPQVDNSPIDRTLNNSKIASLIAPSPTTPLNYGDKSGVAPVQPAMQPQATTSTFVPSVDQNDSLKANILNSGANVTNNSAGGQLRTKNSPNGVVTPLEYQSKVPTEIKLGPDAAAKAQAFGAPTIASFARDFNIPAGTDAQSLWASGREGDANNPYKPTDSDFKQAMAFCDANGFKYTSPQDARTQLQSCREAYAQSAIVNHQQNPGQYGVPNDTVLSDGKTKGVKLYSVPSGGATMPQQEDAGPAPVETQPTQAAMPPTSESTDKGFTLQSLRDILHSLPLQDIGNVVGDLVGQGSRGKLAYAGDYNFRTPQELRQMAQTQRNSDLMKNQGLLNQQFGYESAMAGAGGPNQANAIIQQNTLKAPEQQTERDIANINAVAPRSMAEQAKALAALGANPSNPALFETMQTGTPIVGSKIPGLIATPPSQIPSNQKNAHEKWGPKAKVAPGKDFDAMKAGGSMLANNEVK